MHSYRGRGGPSKSTPANVLCQKCLKRDMFTRSSIYRRIPSTDIEPSRHYSYECTAKPQERPYVPRPSRTQQLLNPKLVPKLTTEVLDDVERKKGIADQELAKKEAERQRKRDLEADEDASHPAGIPPPTASISSSSPSPSPQRRRSESPIPQQSRDIQRGSSSYSGSRSPSGSINSGSESHLKAPRSPDAGQSHTRYADRRAEEQGPQKSYFTSGDKRDSTQRRGSSASNDYQQRRQDRRPRHGADSRSPSRSPANEDRRYEPETGRRYRDREHHQRDSDDRRRRYAEEQRRQPRERSLSPFSKRLALTQSMNSGR